MKMNIEKHTAKEYVIWGKQSGNDHEEPLYTQAKTMEQAELWEKRRVSLYGVKDTRIAICDLSTPPDFNNTILISI